MVITKEKEICKKLLAAHTVWKLLCEMCYDQQSKPQKTIFNHSINGSKFITHLVSQLQTS